MWINRVLSRWSGVYPSLGENLANLVKRMKEVNQVDQ
jgi:hypothetical protein